MPGKERGMKILKNARLLMVIISGSLVHAVPIQSARTLDFMKDFAYPVSQMQALRQELSQALYALQHQDSRSAIQGLHDVSSQLPDRTPVRGDDDYEYIQAMIDRINALIEQIESIDDQREVQELTERIRAIL